MHFTGGDEVFSRYHCSDFVVEVVSKIPKPGIIIQAQEVLDWIDNKRKTTPESAYELVRAGIQARKQWREFEEWKQKNPPKLSDYLMVLGSLDRHSTAMQSAVEVLKHSYQDRMKTETPESIEYGKKLCQVMYVLEEIPQFIMSLRPDGGVSDQSLERLQGYVSGLRVDPPKKPEMPQTVA